MAGDQRDDDTGLNRFAGGIHALFPKPAMCWPGGAATAAAAAAAANPSLFCCWRPLALCLPEARFLPIFDSQLKASRGVRQGQLCCIANSAAA